MIKNVLKYVFTFSIGVLFTIGIYQIPRIKYDVNGDGDVTLADAVTIINYYVEKGNNNE